MMAGYCQTESAEEPFRVRVSLARFFRASDPRAQCYVSVVRSRRVRWLARRLRRLFPLPRRLALLSRGHLLPSDEPLALLRPDDPVEVIPATVELDQIIEDNYIGTKGSQEASTSEAAEPSPNRKKRQKVRHLCGDDLEQIPSEAMNTFTGNNVLTQESKEISQECETPRVSIDQKTGQNPEYLCNKSNTQYSKNSTMPQPISTQKIVQEQDDTELPQNSELLDSEKMRLLKEQALAVLDQVAARPRRRVRVRRRKRALAPPLPLAVDGAQVHPTLDPVSVSDPTLPVEIPTAEMSAFPTRDDDSTGEDTTDASEPISISSRQIDVNAGGGCGPQHTCSPRAAAVLRNPAAAPRVARIVHSLVDVATL